MSLKTYRIDRSFFGKLNNWLKNPDLPVDTLAYLGGSFSKNILYYNRENSFVLSKEDEINRFSEAFGNDWVDDIYYVRHPKKLKSNILIPANRFHEYVVREQLSDMVSFVRANVNVKRLEVKIFKGSNVGVNICGVIKEIPLEGGAKLSLGSSYSILIECDRPLKASEKKTVYTWLEDFPHLVSTLDEAENGSFQVNETFDLSFGVSVKAARAIGANVDWNTNHSFLLHVIA